MGLSWLLYGRDLLVVRPPGWESPADAVSVMLAAATLVLTGVAVALAALAVIGYTKIEEVAREEANVVAARETEQIAPALARQAITQYLGDLGVSVGDLLAEALASNRQGLGEDEGVEGDDNEGRREEDS